MNVMNYTQKASEAATASGDAFKSMLDISLGATQKLFELNGELVRALAGTEGDTTSEFDLNKQVSLHTQRLARTSEYLRELNDICLSTQSEIVKLNAQQTDSLLQVISSQLDEFSKTNPLAAAGFAETLKSTFAMTGTTYEEMINTARELTESSLAATLSALQPPARETGRKATSSRKAA